MKYEDIYILNINKDEIEKIFGYSINHIKNEIRLYLENDERDVYILRHREYNSYFFNGEVVEAIRDGFDDSFSIRMLSKLEVEFYQDYEHAQKEIEDLLNDNTKKSEEINKLILTVAEKEEQIEKLKAENERLKSIKQCSDYSGLSTEQIKLKVTGLKAALSLDFISTEQKERMREEIRELLNELKIREI